SAPENATVQNAGSFTDFAGAVTISADQGTLTQDDISGTWTWSGAAGDEASPSTVTITVLHADGSMAATTFVIQSTDVAPTVTAAQDAVSAPEGDFAHNSGAYADFDDAVGVTGPGVVDNGDGTWSWSGTAPEETAFLVTVTAINADGS